MSDPVQFPRRYSSRADIEIAAFLASAIAWGRRDLILRSAEKMFGLLGPSPYGYVVKGNYRALKDGPIHRTFFEHDLKYFCRGFKYCYEKYGSLEAVFAPAASGSGNGIWDGIALFRDAMARGNNGRFSKHIADPRSASACKRLNLSLRWLVRREGPVDLGLWQSITPASLYIPLDLHVGRVARSLGLLDPARKANDRKAVITLTEKLRAFCPEDPARYDLALFGAGVDGEES
ncbi:MAG: TIGR02757 family protein [Treponema sp.]|nr:TIGR02757 family protein [Treponema sp.]